MSQNHWVRRCLLLCLSKQEPCACSWGASRRHYKRLSTVFGGLPWSIFMLYSFVLLSCTQVTIKALASCLHVPHMTIIYSCFVCFPPYIAHPRLRQHMYNIDISNLHLDAPVSRGVHDEQLPSKCVPVYWKTFSAKLSKHLPSTSMFRKQQTTQKARANACHLCMSHRILQSYVYACYIYK